MSQRIKPTEAELEILQILWEQGPSTVRAVNERLRERREVGYTTTLKLMQIMAEKGLVDRDTSQRTHVYRAAVGEEETQRALLRRFMDVAFRGSATRLVMQLLGGGQTTPEELQAIKEMIERAERREGEKGDGGRE